MSNHQFWKVIKSHAINLKSHIEPDILSVFVKLKTLDQVISTAIIVLRSDCHSRINVYKVPGKPKVNSSAPLIPSVFISQENTISHVHVLKEDDSYPLTKVNLAMIHD
jgi:hypothetical protein